MKNLSQLLFMWRSQTLVLHLKLPYRLHNKMLVMHRIWRLWLLYRGHECYAADCFIHAVGDVINATGGSFYKPLCGAEPA
jgi:hypothetical protein